MHVDPELYPALATEEGVRLLCRYLDTLTSYELSLIRFTRGLDFYSTTHDHLIRLSGARSDLSQHIRSLRAVQRPESAPAAREGVETTPGQGEGEVGAPGDAEEETLKAAGLIRCQHCGETT